VLLAVGYLAVGALVVVIAGRAGGAAPEPSAPVVRRSGGWTLTARCG